MNPTISVIIPSYNYGHLISQTLQSIQDQSLESWECLIVDDGSTDNTADVVNSFVEKDQRFSCILQKNQGLATARNTGIQAAKGAFIQLLDADDLLSKHKLEYQLKYMNEHPDVGISYTDGLYFPDQNVNERYHAFYIDANKQPYFEDNIWIPRLNDAGANIIEFLLWSNIAPVNSMLVRSEVFKEIGGFDPNYKALEDWDFWSRAALSGVKFSFFDHLEAHALVRVHTTSMTFDSMKMDLYFIKLQQDILRELNKVSSLESEAIIKNNRKRVISRLKDSIRKHGLFNKVFISKVYQYSPFAIFIKVYSSLVFKYVFKKVKYV